MNPAEIRAFRQSLGLSAEAFARALGLADGRLIRRWEAGTHSPHGTVAVVIELAMKIPSARAYLIERGRGHA